MKEHKLILTVLLLFAVLFPAEAGHVAGGEIFWKSIHKDTLLVSINVYRDCSGGKLYNAPLTITTSCGVFKYPTTVTGGTEMLPLCSSVCSKCDTPARTCAYTSGIQKWTLSAIVPLDSFRIQNCCDLSLDWILCCRNLALTTSASTEDLYLHAGLDVCDSTLNNVSWHDDLLGIVCLGRDLQSSTFNMSSTTEDDSIVYSWVAARKGARSISYTSPYSYDKPIYFLGFPKATKTFPQGIHLHPETGQLQFRPMVAQLATLCVRAEIYRNGKKVGYSIKDQFVRVVKCTTNEVPTLSGINCSGAGHINFVHSVCVGETIEFDICSSDKNAKDTVILRLFNQIPNASLSISNKGDQRESAHFSWTPTLADVRTKPYQFTVMAEDNACPIRAKTGQVYMIYVSKSKEMRVDTIQKGCGKYLFHTQDKGASYFDNFQWHIDQNPYANTRTSPSLYDTVAMEFNTPGTYPISLKAYYKNRCAAMYSDSIVIPDNFLWIERLERPDWGCPGDSIELQLITHPVVSTPTIIWKGIDTVKADSNTLTTTYTDGWRSVDYSATEGACVEEGSVALIGYNKSYVTLPRSASGCLGTDSFLLEPFSSKYASSDSITAFTWTDSLNNVLSTDSTFTVSDSGLYFLRTTSIRGCNYTDTFYGRLKAPTFQLPTDTAICLGDLATFHASSKYRGTFDWQISNSQQSITLTNTNMVQRYANEPTKVVVTFNDQSRGAYCPVTDSFIFDTLGLPILFSLAPPTTACKGDSIHLVSVNDSAVWTFQNQRFYGAKVHVPVQIDHQKELQYPLHLSTTSSKGCKNDTQVGVWLYIKPKVSFFVADSILAYEDHKPINTSPFVPGHTYQWTVGKPVFKQDSRLHPVFNFDTLGVFNITLMVIDSVKGCSQSQSDTLRVVHNIEAKTISSQTAYAYPNPTYNQLEVVWPGQQHFELRLMSLQGSEVLRTTVSHERSILSLGSLEAGIYILTLQSAEQQILQKIELLQGSR